MYTVYILDITYINAVSIYGQFVRFIGLNFLPEATIKFVHVRECDQLVRKTLG